MAKVLEIENKCKSNLNISQVSEKSSPANCIIHNVKQAEVQYKSFSTASCSLSMFQCIFCSGFITKCSCFSPTKIWNFWVNWFSTKHSNYVTIFITEILETWKFHWKRKEKVEMLEGAKKCLNGFFCVRHFSSRPTIILHKKHEREAQRKLSHFVDFSVKWQRNGRWMNLSAKTLWQNVCNFVTISGSGSAIDCWVEFWQKLQHVFNLKVSCWKNKSLAKFAWK